jgi:hypothetical protein
MKAIRIDRFGGPRVLELAVAAYHLSTFPGHAHPADSRNNPVLVNAC